MPELEEQVTVTQSDRTASRVIGERAVVVVIDDRKLHTLNAVGTRVWELADGRSLGAIADALCDEFEVERDIALADVRRFVSDLKLAGAVKLGGARPLGSEPQGGAEDAQRPGGDPR
jgi:hypothetical protein